MTDIEFCLLIFVANLATIGLGKLIANLLSNYLDKKEEKAYARKLL